MTREDLVTDKQLDYSFETTKFGGGKTKRQIVLDGLVKVKEGWANGHTVDCILSENGLTTKGIVHEVVLTQKGKDYLTAV